MIQEKLKEIPDFVDQVVRSLEQVGIDPRDYFMDHICYRVATQEEYLHEKHALAQYSDLLVETLIGGRMIATYKLREPFVYGHRTLELIELPAPKPGRLYASGWEHVEFVIDCSLEEFAERHPDLKWKFDFKEINPDIRLDFGTFSVKFHTDSLENVIQFEKSLKH
ncbi:dihydroxybiphenyl dioxygenase domain-containing protein [Gorgonomyces haynaldii]|nr:dihydroxybiphenyl dioxygenase domain-containing protein [Gorgonomyces haynaldii]